MVILRALVVRGRAVARRDSSCTDAWKRSLRFVANALDERQSSSDDEADDRKRARVLVCNEGPFRHAAARCLPASGVGWRHRRRRSRPY